jgi:hypothetical protein
MFGVVGPEAIAKALDFARCQRADGTFYGTSGTCRKGVEVKMPKSPGIGPLPQSSIDMAKESAKENSYRWREDKEERVFNEIISKAETVRHLGAITKALIKAIDEGDIDVSESSLLEMKKAMGERLKADGRSSEGTKREKELQEMTPEQRRRARTEEAIKRGIRSGVVRAR